MNILLLNQYALPSGSPGITRHGDLGRVLVKRGHQVTIIASSFDNFTRQSDSKAVNRLEKENHYGVDFIWLKTTAYQANDNKRIKSMLDYSIKAFFKGLKLEKKPDIVIASSPHLLTGLTGLLLATFHKVPFVFEIRDMWPLVLVELGALTEKSISYKILLFIEKLIYKKADKIITIPAFAYKRLEDLGLNSQKCIPIPNGILNDESQNIDGNISLPNSLVTIFKQCHEKKIIMYTGSFGGAHDLHSIIHTAKYLKENLIDIYNQISIIFIGSGRQEEEIKELALSNQVDNIYFHSPIEKKYIKASLAYADILLMPLANINVFKYGLSPNKLYDYLEASKAILISSPTPNTVVGQIKAGVECQAGQPKELAKAIQLLISLPEEERIAMGQRGKEYVREFHNWDKLGEKVETILLEAV